jgi:hypothetical protein
MIRNILFALATFLLGILVILVVMWGVREVLPFIGLPAEIARVAVVIIGLVLLCFLFYLVYRVFTRTGGEL